MAYWILECFKFIEPILVFRALRDKKGIFFLDSSLNQSSLGRYSFLGAEPFYIFKSKKIDPFLRLREEFNKYKNYSYKGFPFFGGLVGFLSYDLGFALEKKLIPKEKESLDISDCFFGFYNWAFIFDHLKKKTYILSLGIPEKRYFLAKALAQSNFKKVKKILNNLGSRKQNQIPKISSERIYLSSDFTKDSYIRAVKKAKEYIIKGDIYQINLSQRFRTKLNLSADYIYERLRRESPSAFSAYLDAGDFQILSSSPERFLKLEKDTLITRPMKGTRPRGNTKLQDKKFKQELLNSPKDKAELLMIVDLERNDLGKVCKFGSVRVKKLREIETYKTVYQTTATILGKLASDKDCFDALRACFPGGSITGCPKIRAMQIIEELEPTRRLIYTGSLGYISFSGNMDFNILIRTILKRNNTLYFGVGGGIVADSLPELEYEETLVKARGILKAIGFNERENKYGGILFG